MLLVEFLSGVFLQVREVVVVFFERSLGPNTQLMYEVNINERSDAVPDPDHNSLLILAFTDKLSIRAEILIEKLITNGVVKSEALDTNKHEKNIPCHHNVSVQDAILVDADHHDKELKPVKDSERNVQSNGFTVEVHINTASDSIEEGESCDELDSSFKVEADAALRLFRLHCK